MAQIRCAFVFLTCDNQQFKPPENWHQDALLYLPTPKMGPLRSAYSLLDRCLHSPGRKIVILFTTKYAIPRQIKPRILELSIRKKQSNSSIVLTFVGCEEIDCYLADVVSAGQLDATTARTNIISQFSYYFWVGRYNKTLNDLPLGKQWVLFPRDPQCSPRRSRGEHWGWGETVI